MILDCNYCGSNSLKNHRIWILHDVKGFTDRELFMVKCNNCRQTSVTLKEKRISDGKVFINQIDSEKNALKTILRESKRIIREMVDIDFRLLNGWIYGTNVQLKNRKGKVVQIRQYSTTFGGDKQLVKKIMVK